MECPRSSNAVDSAGEERDSALQPAGLLSIIDTFVPLAALDGSTEQTRGRAIVAFSWFAGLGGLIAVFITAWQHGAWPAQRSFVLGPVILILLAPHAMRWAKSLALGAWLVASGGYLAVLMAAFNNGGLAAFVVPLIPALPVAVSVLLGIRSSVILTAVLSVALSLLHFGRDSLPTPLVPSELYPRLTFVMLQFSLVLGTGATWIFERLQSRATQAAQVATRTKSEFLRNMSHELRTPLNAVTGLSDLLVRADLGEPEREYASALHRAGAALEHLVENLLDFERLDKNQLELDLSDFEIRVLMDEVAAQCGPDADTKGLEIHTEVDAASLEWRNGDRRMLLRVLINLVSNAVKFTDVGAIGIRARPKGQAVLFEIEDTGIGVPPELQDQIFERFVQGDPSMARRSGGAGLGLAISRQLVGAMGGTIGVESHGGAGSRFWIEVPLRAVDPPDGLTRSSPRFGAETRLRVLVVDDCPTSQMLLTSLLRRRGHVASAAANSREALERAQETPFDVIIVDVELLGRVGSAARGIGGDASSQSCDTPIIALVRNEAPEDRQRWRAAGASAFLAKPLHPDALDRTLTEVLSQGS